MHEMALAQSIVDLVREHARRDRFAHVHGIRLAIGALSQVDPRALTFGLEVVARGTILEGANVAIERPRASAYCLDCCQTVEPAAYGDACPACNGNRWILQSGDDMRVVDLEVD